MKQNSSVHERIPVHMLFTMLEQKLTKERDGCASYQRTNSPSKRVNVNHIDAKDPFRMLGILENPYANTLCDSAYLSFFFCSHCIRTQDAPRIAKNAFRIPRHSVEMALLLSLHRTRNPGEITSNSPKTSAPSLLRKRKNTSRVTSVAQVG